MKEIKKVVGAYVNTRKDAEYAVMEMCARLQSRGPARNRAKYAVIYRISAVVTRIKK